MSPDSPSLHPALRRAPLVGALLGLVVGVVDYAIFAALEVSMRWRGHDVLLVVMLFFVATYLWLGWLLGRLVVQRAALRAQRDVITAQLAELERSSTRLDEAERLAALGAMAAGVAHEVRNPLGVIRSSAALILEDLPAGGDPARAATFICEEVDRLDGFVRELLGFARPLSPRCSPVPLPEVVDAALAIADPALRAAEARVELALAPAPLLADEALLVTLLSGVLVNSAQALAEQGPGAGEDEARIVVRCAPADEAGVAIEVADNGPGLAADVAARAFEPFFTTRARGTGLGLAMAARIVEAHGGALSFVAQAGAGRAGQGACLRILLPGPPATS